MTCPAGPRIAIFEPWWLLKNRGDHFNGWITAFCRRHVSGVFLRSRALIPLFAAGWARARLPVARFRPIVSARHLETFDILVDTNGFNPRLGRYLPPPRFSGLSAAHVMDFVFCPREFARSLSASGVDVLLGYTRHDWYSDFFRHFYGKWDDKVIAVPFGYAPRFEVVNELSERPQRVVVAGALNPVDDPLARPGELDDAVRFFGRVRMHPWREALSQASLELDSVIDSYLPRPPATKNPNYDAVAVLNSTAMFANDVGLMAFPPARTFEGPACGSIMVAPQHGSLVDLGFEHGRNCVMHDPNVESFIESVRSLTRDPEAVVRVARAGVDLVTARYSHDLVADKLKADLVHCFSK